MTVGPKTVHLLFLEADQHLATIQPNEERRNFAQRSPLYWAIKAVAMRAAGAGSHRRRNMFC